MNARFGDGPSFGYKREGSGEGFERMLFDALTIAASGALVVWLTQLTVHRRPPLV